MSGLAFATPFFEAISLDGWTPQPQPAWTTEDHLVETIKGDIGGYEVKGYLLTDTDTQQTLMIDTGYNAQQMLATIKERDLTLIGVCLTHGHADHAGGLDQILAEWPVPVYLGNGDFDLLPWKPHLSSLKIPTNHQKIALGELTVECLATPGHTPGGFCYHLTRKGQSLCFVGDTLLPDRLAGRIHFRSTLNTCNRPANMLHLSKETSYSPVTGHQPPWQKNRHTIHLAKLEWIE